MRRKMWLIEDDERLRLLICRTPCIAEAAKLKLARKLYPMDPKTMKVWLSLAWVRRVPNVPFVITDSVFFVR